MTVSTPNSSITWRHAPHGEIPRGPTTATATIRLRPSATAQWIATLSAHWVSPKDAFSTLHPA